MPKPTNRGKGINENSAAEEEELPPSKSELKRQSHSLQKLGESLLALNEIQLAAMPIDDEQLLEALHECQLIRSNSARKRHLQFIGKLMRNIDPQPIQNALTNLHQEQRGATTAFHNLEELRDTALADPRHGPEEVLKHFPNADRQRLRQFMRQHQHEAKQNKPLAASRKLFRYLRELQDS